MGNARVDFVEVLWELEMMHNVQCMGHKLSRSSLPCKGCSLEENINSSLYSYLNLIMVDANFSFYGDMVPVIATTEPAQNGSILFNQILRCFSSIPYQNHKSCSWSTHREGNFDLQLHLEPKSLSPPPMEPKDRDITGTWTPEPFWSQESVNQEDPVLTPLPHMD